MTILRPYQTQLIDEFLYLKHKKYNEKVMMQLSTGGGKTVIFSEIARKVVSDGGQVLIVAHRNELINQAANKIMALDLQCGVIAPGHTFKPFAEVNVASIASLGKKIDAISDKIRLLIIDEAHHSTAATYRNIIEKCRKAALLGVTATPVRLNGEGFNDSFNKLITGPTMAELIEMGYLCKYKAFGSPIDLSDIKSKLGEFNADQLADKVNTRKLNGGAVDAYLKLAEGKKCISFTINTSHAEAVAYEYNRRGVRADFLTGETRAEVRAQKLKNFERGDIQVMVNCELFTEGMDMPSIEVVQSLRPTQSLAKVHQIWGRGLRPYPGKNHLIILDHANNIDMHGFPDEKINWTLKGPIYDKRQVVAKSSKKEKTLVKYSEIGLDEMAELIPLTRENTQIEDVKKVVDFNTFKRMFDAILADVKTKGHKPVSAFYRTKTAVDRDFTFQEFDYMGLRLGYNPGWARINFKNQGQPVQQPQQNTAIEPKALEKFTETIKEYLATTPA